MGYSKQPSTEAFDIQAREQEDRGTVTLLDREAKDAIRGLERYLRQQPGVQSRTEIVLRKAGEHILASLFRTKPKN